MSPQDTSIHVFIFIKLFNGLIANVLANSWLSLSSL